MTTKFPGLEVAIVNPSRKRASSKGKKTVARKRRRKSNGQFTKGSGAPPARRRRRRRANPESNPAPRRRRRRASSSSPRRRRRNPEAGDRVGLRSGGMWPLRGTDYKLVLPILAQKVLTALVVTKWGEQGRLMSKDGNVSNYAGRSWPLRNYIMSFAVGAVGAKLVGSRFGRKMGEMFYLSNIGDMGARMLWSELFNNTKWGPKYFGQSPETQMDALRAMAYDPNQADAMAGAAMPGAIMDTPSGRFMLDNQRCWQPMQGFGDSLVAADRGFDGFGDSLVAADRGFDGFGRYGHALPPGTEDAEARYHRSGAVDSYNSTYMYG
jgi:hypothetical protein